jgi:DNA modification methylase
VKPTQLNLFASVLHAYSETSDGVIENKDLYQAVANSVGVDEEEANRRDAVGKSGAAHNLFHRKIRWYQQTLRTAGILEHVEGQRGVWQLTKPAAKDLNRIGNSASVLGFSTKLGIAILGSCDSVFSRIDSPITLVLTSPPYPLASARKYGNPTEPEYVDWVCKMLEPLVKNLVQGGSIALNVSNDIFMPQSPARSMYRERLVLALHDRLGLFKMDEFIWVNKSKPPGPYQYASKDRTQLNVAYEPVYWFTNDPHSVKSNNRRVLQEHTERHLALIHQGGEQRTGNFSDGAYSIREGSFGNATEGRIPKNVLEFGHRCAAQLAYKKLAKSLGLPVHGAPMPLKLAKFLIEFLSEPGDLVVDPFGGSFTTADAAEQLGRHWLSTDCMLEYVIGGATRFEKRPGYHLHLPSWTAIQESRQSPELELALA